MLAFAQSRPDDHGGDCVVVEHPARGDVGDGRPVFFRDTVERLEQLLEDGPAAHDLDETPIFHFAPIRHLDRLWCAQPALREEAAAERAEGEELDAQLGAH